MMIQGLIAPVQAPRPAQQLAARIGRRPRLAQRGAPLHAGCATAATGHEHGNHMVAGREVGHARPDLDDLAG